MTNSFFSLCLLLWESIKRQRKKTLEPSLCVSCVKILLAEMRKCCFFVNKKHKNFSIAYTQSSWILREKKYATKIDHCKFAFHLSSDHVPLCAQAICWTIAASPCPYCNVKACALTMTCKTERQREQKHPKRKKTDIKQYNLLCV